jgi:hypothetical protein
MKLSSDHALARVFSCLGVTAKEYAGVTTKLPVRRIKEKAKQG